MKKIFKGFFKDIHIKIAVGLALLILIFIFGGFILIATLENLVGFSVFVGVLILSWLAGHLYAFFSGEGSE